MDARKETWSLLKLTAVDATYPVSIGMSRRAKFMYYTDDPYVVRIIIDDKPDEDDPIIWTVSRDVLIAGITSRAGMGDFIVEPHDDQSVLITMGNGKDVISVSCSRTGMIVFLTRTKKLVPHGDEHFFINMDDVISMIFKMEGREYA